jgi:predicted nucleic acid-binding Zn ribbon protein
MTANDKFWQGVQWGMGYKEATEEPKEKLECPFCYMPIKPEYNNCPYCGAKLPKCPKCGKPIKVDFIACPYCGEKLEEEKRKVEIIVSWKDYGKGLILIGAWLLLLLIGNAFGLLSNLLYALPLLILTFIAIPLGIIYIIFTPLGVAHTILSKIKKRKKRTSKSQLHSN